MYCIIYEGDLVFIFLISKTTIFFMFMNYYSIEFIINWKVTSELYNLKYITRGSNNPLFILKATFYSLSFLILMLLYLHQILSLVKQLASFILLINFWISSKKYLFLIVTSFSYQQFYTSLKRPSFFLTKKKDAIHGDFVGQILSIFRYSLRNLLNSYYFFTDKK